MDGDQEEAGRPKRPRRQAARRVQTASTLSQYQSPDLNEDEALQVALLASLESIPEADLSDDSLQSQPLDRPSTSARGFGSASASSRRSSGATAADINEDSSSGEDDDDIEMAKGDRQVSSGDGGHRPKGKPGPKPKGDGKMSAKGSDQQQQGNGNSNAQVSATGQRTLEEERNGVGRRQDDERTRLEKEAKNFSLFPDVAILAKDFINFMRVTPMEMILQKQLVVPFARSMPLEEFERKFKADQALERAEEEERARAAEAVSEAQEDEEDEDEDVQSDDEEDKEDPEQDPDEASDDASDSDANDRPASRPSTSIRRRKKRARIVLSDRRPPKRSSTDRSPASTRDQGANKKPKQ